jgi:Tol biopolymer transport system component
MGMRKTIAVGVLLCLAGSVWYCSGCSGFPRLAGPYLGQEPPGMTPRRFAPQVIRQEVHCAPVFSPDGQEAYWVLMNDNAYNAELQCSRLVDGIWTQPAVASFSQRQKDDSPVFSPDGNRLYFLRNDGTKENIYYVERAAGGWAAPVALPSAVNSLTLHWQLSVATNGDLYFAGKAPSDVEQDIYRAELVDGQYTLVTKLEGTVNSDLMEHSPYIAKDGSYLLFSRANQQLTNADLYVSFREADGSWGQAIRFGDPINAAGHDHCPRVSDDGKYLFFVTTRGGGSQAYWVDASVIEELRPR